MFILPIGFLQASNNLQICQVIKRIHLSNAVTGQRLDPSQKSLQASRTISADPWVRSWKEPTGNRKIIMPIKDNFSSSCAIFWLRHLVSRGSNIGLAGRGISRKGRRNAGWKCFYGRRICSFWQAGCGTVLKLMVRCRKTESHTLQTSHGQLQTLTR